LLAQKFAVGYISKIVVQCVQMATSLIVARLVGPGVLGTLAYGLAFASMFSFISDLGIGSAHIRILSEGKENENDCNCTFLSLKSFLMFTYVVFTLLIFYYKKYLQKSGFESNDQEIVVLIYIVIIFVSQLFTFFSSYWAAKTEQIKQDLPTLIQTLVYQILRVALALFGYKAVELALGNLFAVLIVIPLYFWLGRNIKLGMFKWSIAKKYIGLSIPLILILFSQVVIYSFDKIYLQSQTNLKILGNYSAGLTLASFIKTIEGSLGLLFFPLFSRYITENQIDIVNDIIKKYEKINFFLIMPMVLIASITSRELILITYGNKFNFASDVFAFAIISFFISTITLPYANILTGLGKFKESSIIWISSGFIFLTLAYILVHKNNFNLAAKGMAIAILGTNLFLLLTYLLYLKKVSPFKIRLVTQRSLVVFNLSFFALVFLAYSLLPKINTLLTISFVVPILLLYLILVWLFKLVEVNDLRMLKNLVNPKRMKNYIKSELK